MARFSDEKRLLTAALIDEGQRLTAAMSSLFNQMVSDGHGNMARWALTCVRLEDVWEGDGR
jgi:hypothetical protein